MKKLFFFIAAAATVLTGCSDDDGPKTSGTVSFTVDGVTKTYTAVTIQKYNGPSPHWFVLAAPDDASEMISIEVPENVTGTQNPVWNVKYSADNMHYEADGGPNLTSTVETNTKSKLAGTFAGTLAPNGDTAVEPKQVTNGTFDIRH